jgi:16S rRNA processing protein RimM
MNATAYVELGVIQRKQGLKGNVVARFNHDKLHLDGVSTLFVQINHTLVPYRVEQLSYQHRKAIIKLQGVDNPEAAHYLQGRFIFIPQEALPQAPAQVSCLDELLGYHVVDGQEGSLGIVQAVYALTQQRLLAVDYRGRELLVPYHEDIVIHLDHAQQTISVQLPSGFIEAMY